MPGASLLSYPHTLRSKACRLRRVVGPSRRLCLVYTSKCGGTAARGGPTAGAADAAAAAAAPGCAGGEQRGQRQAYAEQQEGERVPECRDLAEWLVIRWQEGPL